MCFDDIKNPRKAIVWLGVKTDLSGWITKPSSLNSFIVSTMLARQDWHVIPWRYESSTYTTELWPWLLKCPKGNFDISVQVQSH